VTFLSIRTELLRIKVEEEEPLDQYGYACNRCPRSAVGWEKVLGWALNPRAYKQLAPLGTTVGTLFLLLSAALGIAGTGWLRRRKWAWQLAVIIIATQVLEDLANTLRGHVVQGSVGVMVAGALLLYLFPFRLRQRSVHKPSTCRS